MTTPSPLPQGQKTLLELGPIAVFILIISFGARFGLEETVQRFVIATAALIPLSIAALTYIWVKERKTPWMLLVSTLLLTFFGGLTIYFNDASFLQLKVTLVNLLFAGVLGVSALFSLPTLKALMGQSMTASDGQWRRATIILALGFALAAALNELMRAVWADNLTAWGWGAKVGLPILGMAVMILALWPIIRDNMPAQETDTPT